MRSLKDLFEEYFSLPKSPRRSRIGRIIRGEKRKLVETFNYVDIIYILRFLENYERDRLFLELLDMYPESSLFVLEFADSEMRSYTRAYENVKSEYKGDENLLRKNVEMNFDKHLCEFLNKYKSGEDLDYIQKLVDGASWLESYERVVHPH